MQHTNLSRQRYYLASSSISKPHKKDNSRQNECFRNISKVYKINSSKKYSKQKQHTISLLIQNTIQSSHKLDQKENRSENTDQLNLLRSNFRRIQSHRNRQNRRNKITKKIRGHGHQQQSPAKSQMHQRFSRHHKEIYPLS